MNELMLYGRLKRTVEGLGHKFFDTGQFNLNIIGLRTDDDASNKFNDFMYVAYRDAFDNPVVLKFAITTDPGVHYRENPLNKKGTGIIVPGQHKGLWELGTHRGEHPALVQKNHVPVYRDNDGDAKLDFDEATIEWCLGGFNCHRATEFGVSILVGKWSAGCQVLAANSDMEILLALCERSAEKYGNSFTYTLITEEQVRRLP